MTHTRFPNLECLALFNESTPASLALISANRSIKRLFCRNSPYDIVNIAPQLVELHILPDLQTLCSSSPQSPLPFPSLRHLFLNMTSPGHGVRVEGFEMLVRTRCLPVGHPRSLAKHSSQVLSSLTVVLPVNPASRVATKQVIHGLHSFGGHSSVLCQENYALDVAN
ncbi:hypothetical protein M408DRAFT_264197 [Serendipita vermifera MAFF 305830]|uniref:F-box domain-containing protein n=1 Tax=Serendipita vermifera MAFF 305830 TaxID=933852 RepID=A0A0C3AVK5_SERVB|nr:hypothetical protein M408DRAFT_264197 [Serendipita vermifera MAFF 305830]